MPIFLVTNRKTHSRAVIVAESEQKARELRPDGAVWRHDKWQVYDYKISDFRNAPVLPAWPVDPEHVCADILGLRAVDQFNVEDVVAFESSTQPREVGEGPDGWWDENGNLR